MFLSLKDKFKKVTKNVGLTPPEQTKNPEPIVNSVINFDAGAAILNRFQLQWAEMHALNEENAKNATALAENIETTYNKVTKDRDNLSKISGILTETNSITKNVSNCVKQLTELHSSFGIIEKALIDLEDLIERFELQEKQLEHKFQLALYREKKLANLDHLRSKLAEEHSQQVREFEMKQKKRLQERQQVFQEAFKSDLETFKSLGTIPKIESPSHQPSALLEEIQLETDDTELEQFLEK